MPNRINRAIELLEQDQPIYYTGGHTGANLSYEDGKEMAGTWADYINVGMEHGSFDMPGLDQFMRGLADGGPTNSGHRTPAVVVEAPVDGASGDVVRANSWQFRQVLAPGRAWNTDVPRRDTGRGEGFRRVLPLSVPDHRRRQGARHGSARLCWTGGGGPDLGSVCGRVPGQGRPVAAEPGRRADARPQDRKRARSGERRGDHTGARHNFRRMGAGRHEHVYGLQEYARESRGRTSFGRRASGFATRARRRASPSWRARRPKRSQRRSTRVSGWCLPADPLGEATAKAGRAHSGRTMPV